MTTTDPLPSVRWREPRDVAAVLDIPPAGVLLGTDPDGNPVVLPAVGPRVTRIGVVGDGRIAGLLVYRLLGVGCVLRIATASPDRWRHLLGVAGGRASVGPSTAAWPPRSAAEGPPLLVSDLDTAPDHLGPDHLAPDHLGPDHLAPDHLAPDHLAPDHLAPDHLGPDHLGPGERRHGTVVHLVPEVGAAGPFWSAVDAVVVTGPGHGGPLARLLDRDDARALDRLGRTEVGLLDHHRVVAVTPLLAPGE